MFYEEILIIIPNLSLLLLLIWSPDYYLSLYHFCIRQVKYFHMLLFILEAGYLILNTISEMNILLHFILTVHVYNFKIMCKSSEKQSELLVKVPKR